MEGKSEDKHLDWILIVLLFLIFMIVLIIFTGSIRYFYRDSDTLLAGMIAFIGAILGGTITLVGVNKTLLENRRRERLNQIPKVIRILKEEARFIHEFQNEFNNQVKKNEVNELEGFLFDSRSKLYSRRDEQNILACGEEIYNLYNTILMGTLELLMVMQDAVPPAVVPKIKSTDAYWEICLEYQIVCEIASERLVKEYYSLEKNL